MIKMEGGRAGWRMDWSGKEAGAGEGGRKCLSETKIKIKIIFVVTVHYGDTGTPR